MGFSAHRNCVHLDPLLLDCTGYSRLIYFCTTLKTNALSCANTVYSACSSQRIYVPGSRFASPPPQWYGPPRTPPCQQLPITYVYLLPAIPYLLPITTYYYLLPTTNCYLPHTTPPHRGRGDWTMLLLLRYHDHGWGGGTQNLEHIFPIELGC